MTEKLARRGTQVRAEYAADHLALVLARDAGTRPAVVLEASTRIGDVRARFAEGGRAALHQGFPVLDADGRLVGVVTRRELLDPAFADEETVADAIVAPRRSSSTTTARCARPRTTWFASRWAGCRSSRARTRARSWACSRAATCSRRMVRDCGRRTRA